MTDNIFFRFLMTLQALQCQYRSIMENRPELMEHSPILPVERADAEPRSFIENQYRLLEEQGLEDGVTDGPRQAVHTSEMLYEDPRTEGNQTSVDSEDLNKLTEIEEQLDELEENLLAEISSHRPKGWNLYRRVRNLQRRLRATLTTLRARSKGQFLRGHRFSSRSMLDLKNIVAPEMRTRRPLRCKSEPDIPSTIEDFDFDPITKWRSMITNLNFTNLHKSQLRNLQRHFNFLEDLYQNLMKEWKETSSLQTRNQPLQAHNETGSEGSPESSLSEESCLGSESNNSESLNVSIYISEPTGQNPSETTSPSPQAARRSLRSESPASTSDSSTARRTASGTTSHSSGQSEQHHSSAMHTRHPVQHQNPGADRPTRPHRSHRNDPGVSPSQNVTGSQSQSEEGNEREGTYHTK